MSDDAEPGHPSRPSGLRDPARAVRSVAAAALTLEALSVLLALAPIARLSGGLSAGQWIPLAALSLLLVGTAGSLRRRWAYPLGSILQVAVLACGLFTPAMFVVGAAYGLVWIYALRLRRTVAGGE